MASKTDQNDSKNILIFILLACIAYFIFFYESSEKKQEKNDTLFRKNPSTQIDELNDQSVRKNDQNLSKPGIGRTIKGLDGLNINEDL